MATRKVLVTGAGGRSGSLVVQRLVGQHSGSGLVPIAGVRSQQSKAALLEKVQMPENQVVVLDISQQAEVKAQLSRALQGCAALIIATSAVPEVIPPAAGAPPGPPNFKWKEGQTPEQVDWLGQKVQIDAAKEAGVPHVVVIGSMGGTKPDHPLNRIAGGNILQWKRKAEQYLIQSGVSYTIVHAGGLQDQPGGERQLLLGVDDTLLQGENRSVPRADVAEVCIQSVLHPEYRNKALDLASMPPGQGAPTTDFVGLVNSLGGKTCDYTINSQL